MSGSSEQPVAPLTSPGDHPHVLPRASTAAVWTAWAVSLVVLTARVSLEGYWGVAGVISIDGLTALTWSGVTLLSGVVHSYARRYLDGDRHISRFFARALCLTGSVMLLVAAEHLALFVISWLVAGWAMSGMIGHHQDWAQARRAGRLSFGYFLTSTLLLATASTIGWWSAGVTTIDGLGAQLPSLSSTQQTLVIASIIVAGMIQSALLPFHRWLASSMTAPTPASALMHAGFVNAGGLLFARFSNLLSTHALAMMALVTLGAVSAIGGKLLKSVQSGIKNQLGCSTIGQMGFMILQAGLGFFAASITHLLLHGFYKAYLFLSSGGRVAQTAPPDNQHSQPTAWHHRAVSALAGVGGGFLFAFITGKGWQFGAETLLVVLVVLATYRATRQLVAHSQLNRLTRYLAAPAVFAVAISAYGLIYNGVAHCLGASATVPFEWTSGHTVLVALFAGLYLVVETDFLQQSDRLYVALLNSAKPSDHTLLVSREDYRE
jgi:NAD(P)H-quinone oxidoreductase subunit 5